MYPKMEPMFPSGMVKTDKIAGLAIELVEKNAIFKHNLFTNHFVYLVSDLLRNMNCYYSTLIEGHHTTLSDIENALNGQYDTIPEKRDLQLEAKAHIAVQKNIDDGIYDDILSLSACAIQMHYDFYNALPESLHKVYTQDHSRVRTFKGGELRCDSEIIQVGTHIPPNGQDMQKCLTHFDKAYANLGKQQQIFAIATAHHRLCWIHPFFDGNGRVARLLSHYMLRQTGAGSPLWSVSRGLALDTALYKKQMQHADIPRQGDLDGRGNLSEKALVSFIAYFLTRCIDQVDFMGNLMQPQNILRNIERYTEQEIQQGNLMKGSFAVLREALHSDTVPRGKASELTGYRERQAREVLKTLQNKKLIISKTAKGQGAFSLNIPAYVVPEWFPNL